MSDFSHLRQDYGRPRKSDDFFSSWSLICRQKGFHQIALSADNHSGKSFKPSLIGHFGLGGRAIQQTIQAAQQKSRATECDRADDPAEPAEAFAAEF